MNYVLEPLPYGYADLEPVMDFATVELHYSKHHQTYLNNLNAALEGMNPNKRIDELLLTLDTLPLHIQTIVKNNGGGYYNHTLFWKMLTPNKNQAPQGALKDAINNEFGSVEAFQTAFEEAGKKQFGSGWVWLIETPNKRLKIVTTANQETPLKEGKILLAIDVWEHAYYLKYLNKRADYLHNIWQIVNWRYVESLYVA